MTRAARPNLLLVIADQHRFDFTGANPELPPLTPVLDRLAARGVSFTNAVTPAPLCAPARACLASGRSYDRCGVAGNAQDYPLDQQTYYGLLRDSGYHVAGAGKFDLHKATLDWQLDGSRHMSEWGFSEGIDSEGKHDAIKSGAERPAGPYMAELHRRALAAQHVRDYARHKYRDTDPTPLPDDLYGDNWIAENALGLLDRCPADRPWHLVVNFSGPHEPMDVTAGMRQRWAGVRLPPPHDNDEWDAATHQRIRQNYAAMIENIDRHLGRLQAAVEARGELGRTVIVYTSDHGEMLGDHGRWEKSTYYHPSVGIPLVVAGPGIRAGVSSDAPVSLHDLAATALELARLDLPEGMDSRTLLPLLTGQVGRTRDVVFAGLHDWRMAYDGRYKLIRRCDAPTLLFDRARDPAEDDNIASTAPDVVVALLTAMARELAGSPGWV